MIIFAVAAVVITGEGPVLVASWARANSTEEALGMATLAAQRDNPGKRVIVTVREIPSWELENALRRRH